MMINIVCSFVFTGKRNVRSMFDGSFPVLFQSLQETPPSLPATELESVPPSDRDLLQPGTDSNDSPVSIEELPLVSSM
jgi:hypothetical protein